MSFYNKLAKEIRIKSVEMFYYYDDTYIIVFV